MVNPDISERYTERYESGKPLQRIDEGVAQVASPITDLVRTKTIMCEEEQRSVFEELK